MLALSVPGCRNAIEPDVSGLLAPVRDTESLALAVEELLANPKQRTAMGLAGRKLAETEFDVCTLVDKHFAIYLRLLTSQ